MALWTNQTCPGGKSCSLYKIVVGLITTARPGGKGAFKNAAVTSQDATAWLEDDADGPQDSRYLIMAVSRHLAIGFRSASILTLTLSGFMVKTPFAGSSTYFRPFFLASTLICAFLSGRNWLDSSGVG